jgi:glycosyltransferase involved in cell wall biosynthesis
MYSNMLDGAPYLSVVVPCHNESDCMDELHRRLKAACDGLFKPYEIVYVNDGSRDDTWDRICALADRNDATVGVNLSRNFGQQSAVVAGLNEARGDRVLLVDADLQDPPELLPRMLELMEDCAADVVYGKRRSRKGESVWKRMTAATFYRVFNRLAEVPIPNDTGDFRLISRRALDAFLAMQERRGFSRGMMSWVGFHQVPIEYDRDPRFAGVTKWPSAKMLRLAIDAIVSSSLKPLRLSVISFFVTALLGAGLGAVAIREWLSGTAAGGMAIGAVVAFLQSAHFLVLAVLSEYLGRVHEQSQGRPAYIVQEVRRRRVNGTSVGPRAKEMEITHVG